MTPAATTAASPTAPADVELNLAIPDSTLSIRGILRAVPDSRALVVYSHGLCAGPQDLQPYTFARALSEVGISSYRFAYYGYGTGFRSLLNCTVDQHVADLRQVVATFRAAAPDRKIVVVGHSLGGLTAVAANAPGMDAVVLWDATHDSLWPDGIEDDETTWEREIGLYRMRWGIDILITKAMLESYRLLDCDAAAREITVPLLAIAAGDGVLEAGQQSYVANAGGPSELVTIPGADHNFTAGETLTELIERTISWIQGTTREK